MSITDVAGALREGFRGQVITPGHEEYEQARQVYNSMIDRRPLIVARCADPGDVLAAVRFAVGEGLEIAVRGGSHNVAGFGTVDGGLVIDLGAMRSVRVDPQRRIARVEGGATLGDLDHATGAFGLATPGGIISTTGVAGLTLGGGIGYLSRRYGLTCDNLLSADVITADGRLVTTSAHEHPDLFWALRGGGGNFGVVTSFEFALHPAGTVLGGPIFYDLDRAAELIAFWQDYLAGAPEELGSFFGFQIGPPADFIPGHLQGVTMCAVMCCWAGDLAEGEKVLAPLREFGPPLLDLVQPMPYPVVQSLFDGLLPPGLRHYWKAAFADEQSAEAIAVHAEHGAKVPTFQSTMHLYPVDGAVHRVGATETAFFHRDARYAPNVVGVWTEEADDAANIAWVRRYYDALQPHLRTGGYVNFLLDDDAHRVQASYGDNYVRLEEVKRTWDPDNRFHLNQNITQGR